MVSPKIQRHVNKYKLLKKSLNWTAYNHQLLWFFSFEINQSLGQLKANHSVAQVQSVFLHYKAVFLLTSFWLMLCIIQRKTCIVLLFGLHHIFTNQYNLTCQHSAGVEFGCLIFFIYKLSPYIFIFH